VRLVAHTFASTNPFSGEFSTIFRRLLKKGSVFSAIAGPFAVYSMRCESEEKGREGKGREGKGREGKGREGKGREGKGREGKGREGKGREEIRREE
jgi:hypothetical protein